MRSAQRVASGIRCSLFVREDTMLDRCSIADMALGLNIPETFLVRADEVIK